MKNLMQLMIMLCFFTSQAQVILDGNDIYIHFNDFMASGICLNPEIGQLNSGEWSISGMSNGEVPFNGCEVGSGDFSRGYSLGNVISGGIYSFQVNEDERALGVQPTSSDFSPGSIILRLQNNTGESISILQISYDLWVNNNKGRSSYWHMSTGVDIAPFIFHANMSDTSLMLEDTLGFVKIEKSFTFSEMDLADGKFLYVKWEGGDVAGSGSRDEFAINNIQIKVPQGLPAGHQISNYTIVKTVNNRLIADVSRLEGPIYYRILDIMGNEIIVDTVINQDQIVVPIPEGLNHHYLHMKHNSIDRWIKLIK